MEYTKYAKDALRGARNIAKKNQSLYIGTEHLLLSLVKVKNGVAAQVLDKYEIRLKDINEIIITLLGVDGTDSNKIANSIRLEAVIAQSRLEAIQQKSEKIGTEHLLIAIMRDEECAANRVFNSLKIPVKDLLEDLMLGTEREEDTDNQENENSQGSGEFLKDLTAMAAANKLDPVLGRETQMERIIEIISRRTKNNPCLVGEPGIGKTAIVEGIAQKIVDGEVPDTLKDKKILSLDLAGMLAGTKYRGEFEERIKKLIKLVEEDKNIILFMDEVHTIVGAGGSEGSIDAANMFKPSLSRGNLQLIGATTTGEYRKYIEKDLALERRFQPVDVNEPTTQECVEILSGIKNQYEKFHNVVVDESLLLEIVKLSKRYITDRFLPDKAIDILDEACTKVHLRSKVNQSDIRKMEAKLNELEKDLIESLIHNSLDSASEFKKEILLVKKQIIKYKNKQSSKQKSVTIDDVKLVVSSWSKVPITRIQKDELDKLKDLEVILKNRVTGQVEAIETVSKAIKRGRVGLKSPTRPIGSFLFLGPTGVGKTELSKAVTEILFDTEENLIRIDMSEYMEKQSVSKLIGSPPGYVGYGEGGQLTEKVRTNPYAVILFDEVEKAHPDVFNVLLQVLDEGHVTDSKGRKVDFKNTIIIMTSNAGASAIVNPKELGFATKVTAEDKHKSMKNKVMEELKTLFRPEFLNRIDDIIVFHMLDNQHMLEIVERLTDRFIDHVKVNINVQLEVTDEVKKLVLEKGTDIKYGARPLRRALQQEIEDVLAEALLEGSITSGDRVTARVKKGKVTFQKK